MPRPTRLLFTIVLALSSLVLAACSEQQEAPPGPRAETAETAPQDRQAPGEQLPEVVVLYGQEDLVPWLEAENWWGEATPEQLAAVPYIMITAIHPSWSEYSSSLPVPVKKALFYRLMLPLVMHANAMTMSFRDDLLTARDEYRADSKVSPESLEVIRRVALLLPDMEVERAQAIAADDEKMGDMLDALLYRVDAVPAGLALGQAAYESGYGTSRFATEGNSLFGQWTYKGDGIKPQAQRTSTKGDHRIKAFEWPFDSVRGYFINLMSHPAYEDFRRLRAEMRAAGKPLNSLELADGLLRYSERGEAYVKSLKGIIRVNKLDSTDEAVFRDGPMRFLISEQSREAVAETEARLEEARQSGELADILQRMRLE